MSLVRRRSSRPAVRRRQFDPELEMLLAATGGRYLPADVDCVRRTFEGTPDELLEALLAGRVDLAKHRALDAELRGCSKLECRVCFDEVLPEEMLTLSCEHRFCTECVSRQVQVQLEESALPCCLDLECKRLLTIHEIRGALAFLPENADGGREAASSSSAAASSSAPAGGSLSARLLRMAETLLLRSSLADLAAIGCPQPGCDNFVIPASRNQKERGVCPGCSTEFCCKCLGTPFHFDCDCDAVPGITADWHEWLETGWLEYLQARAAEDSRFNAQLAEFQQRRMDNRDRLRELQLRRKQLEKDEKVRGAGEAFPIPYTAVFHSHLFPPSLPPPLLPNPSFSGRPGGAGAAQSAARWCQRWAAAT